MQIFRFQAIFALSQGSHAAYIAFQKHYKCPIFSENSSGQFDVEMLPPSGIYCSGLHKINVTTKLVTSVHQKKLNIITMTPIISPQ